MRVRVRDYAPLSEAAALCRLLRIQHVTARVPWHDTPFHELSCVRDVPRAKCGVCRVTGLHDAYAPCGRGRRVTDAPLLPAALQRNVREGVRGGIPTRPCCLRHYTNLCAVWGRDANTSKRPWACYTRGVANHVPCDARLVTKKASDSGRKKWGVRERCIVREPVSTFKSH